MSDALPYTRGTHMRRLLGVRSYLNNYLACIHVCRAPGYAWNPYPPPTWDRNYLSTVTDN